MKKLWIILATVACVGLSLVAIWAIYHSFSDGPPKTHTSEGSVSGVHLKTYGNRSISAFLGIPFAEPPIGDLRFKNPEWKKKWDGVYEANKDGSFCPQTLDDSDVQGNEDCLYLNVFTPKLFDESKEDKDLKLLPVMFWIHGGGFRAGSSNSEFYNPNYLLDKNVILVATNYRLGILGFLSTGDSASPGNYGLKDMVLALNWVQKNIEAFGGDAKKVTIFGESAGGAAVELLMLSHATDGLFQRAISQSGSALATWAFRKQPEYAIHAQIVGNRFGCDQKSSDNLVACLRNIETFHLLNESSVFKFDDELYSWSPTREPNLPGAVLTDSPKNILKRGDLKKLDWMTGALRDEGMGFTLEFYKNDEKYQSMLKGIDEYLGFALKFDMDSNKVDRFVKDIKRFYFNNTFTNKSEILKQMAKFKSDSIFLYPMTKVIERTLNAFSNPVYFYNFNFCGASSDFSLFTNSSIDCAISHFQDVSYLFKMYEYNNDTSTMKENDMKIVQIMVDLWTSFAINGIPVTTAVDNGKIWEPYNRHKTILSIGDQFEPSLSLKNSFYNERMAFWDAHYSDVYN